MPFFKILSREEYFMKIIHLADVHLGSKIEAKLPKDKAEIRKSEVRQAFNKVINYANENDIKIILISGDLFDSARPLKKDKDFFGLDDLGIIDIYLNWPTK